MADFGAGALFGAINTAFKFSEFVIALNEVGSENNVFVRTIQRVRLDLDEIQRLLSMPSIKLILAQTPQKLLWVHQAIHSTKTALNDIGRYVERVRSEKDRDGEISFENRVRWVLKDHGKIENRRSELAACHQTLTAVLGLLVPLEMQPTGSSCLLGSVTGPRIDDIEPPTYEDAAADSGLRSPYQRKKDKARISEAQIAKDVSNSEGNRMVVPAGVTVAPTFVTTEVANSSPSGPPPPPPPKQPLSTFGNEHNTAPFEERALSGNNHFGPLNPWDILAELPQESAQSPATASSTFSIMSTTNTSYFPQTDTGDSATQSWHASRLHSDYVTAPVGGRSNMETPTLWTPPLEQAGPGPSGDISRLGVSVELPSEITSLARKQVNALTRSRVGVPAAEFPFDSTQYVPYSTMDAPESRYLATQSSINAPYISTDPDLVYSEGMILSPPSSGISAAKPVSIMSRATHPSPTYSDGMTRRPQLSADRKHLSHLQGAAYSPYVQPKAESEAQDTHARNRIPSPTQSFVSVSSGVESDPSLQYTTYHPYVPGSFVQELHSNSTMPSPPISSVPSISPLQAYRPYRPKQGSAPANEELHSTNPMPSTVFPSVSVWSEPVSPCLSPSSIAPSASRRRKGLRDIVLGIGD